MTPADERQALHDSPETALFARVAYGEPVVSWDRFLAFLRANGFSGTSATEVRFLASRQPTSQVHLEVRSFVRDENDRILLDARTNQPMVDVQHLPLTKLAF